MAVDSPKGLAKPVQANIPSVPQSGWERYGKFLVTSVAIVAILGTLGVGMYLRADHIFTNMGTDFAIGGSMGLVALAIVLRIAYSLTKDKNAPAVESSVEVQDVNLDDREEPKKESKWKLPLFIIGLLGILALVTAAGYFGIGHAGIGQDHGKAFFDFLRTIRDGLSTFSQHTFQPMGDFLKQYFDAHGEAVGFGAATTLVGLPLLIHSCYKMERFVFKSDDTGPDEPKTLSRSRSGSISSVDSEEAEFTEANRRSLERASGIPRTKINPQMFLEEGIWDTIGGNDSNGASEDVDPDMPKLVDLNNPPPANGAPAEPRHAAAAAAGAAPAPRPAPQGPIGLTQREHAPHHNSDARYESNGKESKYGEYDEKGEPLKND